MSKKIVALAGAAIVACISWTNAAPVHALPGCVANTAVPTCSVQTGGELVEILGRAEGGSLTIYDANGGVIQQHLWGMGLASLSFTNEVFDSVAGGRAVLTIQGVGAVTLGSA